MSTPKSHQAGDSVPQREEFRPSLRTLIATVIAVAATYFYFLIFAQFGFLQTVQARAGEDGTLLRPLMAVMGLCGIAGSFVVARIYAVQRGRRLMLGGFIASGLAAQLSVMAGSVVWLYACAVLIGTGTATITVTLAAMLRREVGAGKLGVSLGAGTGLAYGLCNLPIVFNASPSGHAGWGIAACVVGCLAVAAFTQQAPAHEENGFDYRPGMIGGWVAVFFALVWLDSAAFYVIQHTPALKVGTWGRDAQLYLNAIVHAAAALLAGLVLDRRLAGMTILTAAVLLVAAGLLLGVGPGVFSTAAFCYAAGVSFYSTALIYYPAYSGRAILAALVYAIAGWGGSALGIGMAQNLTVIPVGPLAAVGAILVGIVLARSWIGWRKNACLFCALVLLAVGWPQNDLSAQDAVEAGRKVYIAEGCIHCHSQYVRPDTNDEILWGPARSLAEALAQMPPLLGNRRQGPDLQNVGLRRLREWNQQHLMAPRTLSPGSRMPSYRHLFTGDAARGEALLDYLTSLGRPVVAGTTK